MYNQTLKFQENSLHGIKLKANCRNQIQIMATQKLTSAMAVATLNPANS